MSQADEDAIREIENQFNVAGIGTIPMPSPRRSPTTHSSSPSTAPEPRVAKASAT